MDVFGPGHDFVQGKLAHLRPHLLVEFVHGQIVRAPGLAHVDADRAHHGLAGCAPDDRPGFRRKQRFKGCIVETEINAGCTQSVVEASHQFAHRCHRDPLALGVAVSVGGESIEVVQHLMGCDRFGRRIGDARRQDLVVVEGLASIRDVFRTGNGFFEQTGRCGEQALDLVNAGL